MGKHLALILALLMIPGLLGCAGRTAAAEGSVPAAAPAPEAVVESTPEPTAAPTPEPTPEPTPRPLLPVELNDSYLDPFLFAPAQEQGHVELVEYETADYTGGGETVTKRMAVYLPYGYDPEKQYNVLFLLHTAGGDEKTWLVYAHDYHFAEGIISVNMTNLLDNAIQQGRCAPLIVVGPSGYLNENAIYDPVTSHRYEQFDREFAEDILPFVAENFATFARSGSHEDLVEARHHFGVLGASYGAYMNNNSVLSTHLDLVASYSFIGGGTISTEYLFDHWYSRGFLDYDIDCFYFAEGEYDDRSGPEGSFIALRYMDPPFNDENLLYTTVYGAGHEPRAWINGLYNTLQLFFRDRDEG